MGVGERSLEQAPATRASCTRRALCPSKFRIYEVRSISHAGSGPGLNIAPLWGQLLAMLDAWVEKGAAPPPSRSDWAIVGDADKGRH